MDMDAPKLTSSAQVTTIKAYTPPMATITFEGEVLINWGRVEQEAAGKDLQLRPIAQALIAVGDKTYKPLADR